MASISIAFCWCFPDEPPERGLRRLADAGFEAIELWPRYLQGAGPKAWADALSATGMRCAQLCPYFDFMHGAERIADSRRQLDEFLAAARVIGCRKLRVFTGPPWGEGVVNAEDATPQQWDDATRHLRQFCDIAAADGVELCLECHRGALAESGPTTLRLLAGVDRPNLTVNLQLPMHNEPWQTSLELLGRYTTHIHIHNWTIALGEGQLTFLNAGKFAWEPVVSHLVRDLHRDVCLSVEHADHGRLHDPWETARRDGPFLRRLRETILKGPEALHPPRDS
jgi:sugar phosphate isomerase/epimerase